MITNGYINVYLPTHPRAHSNGCVYEHILKAEEKIGRYLTKDEVVHHINHNRHDNNLDNLIIFKSTSDHSRFHITGTYFIDEFGIAYSPIEYNKCKICGKPIDSKAKLCWDCHKNNIVRNSKMPPRYILENLIYKYSMCEIGKMFGVSDNAIGNGVKNMTYHTEEKT